MEAESSEAPLSQDGLLGGRVRLRQPASGYRAGVDPVLLAAAVPARNGDAVLELGSGVGAASLCLAARVPHCAITGIDSDDALVSVANANAGINGVADRVEFVSGDVAAILSTGVGASFEHAIANPPFLEPSRADLRNLSPARRNATIESTASLEMWLSAMCRAVNPKGRITLIQRADRLAEILALLRPLAGDIAVLPLWPKAGRAARRVIVTARPGTATPMRLLNGLVLHRDDGRYTPEAMAILRDGAPLDL